MRVLVTGGCGFIGAHLVTHLVARGDHVVVLDDLSVGTRESLPVHDRLRVDIGSVEDARAVRAAGRDCDLVIHLAGIVGMELVAQKSECAYRVAVDGTECVLAETTAPAILVSSSCIYGTAGVCRESDPIEREEALAADGGSRGYASGKWELEAKARAARAAGRAVLVVRPFNVVGPGQTHRYGMVLPRFIRSALREEPLVIYDDGRQTRAFSFVEDFVHVLAKLATMPDAWSRCDNLINLGNPSATSILDLARTVLEATKSSSRLEHRPYHDVFPGRVDVTHRIPDTARTDQLLGPFAWTNLQEIVRATVASERSRS